MKTSDAQKKANSKWAEKNKERRSYLSSRSSARSFIRNKATPEDLLELSKMIDEKLTEHPDILKAEQQKEGDRL